MIISGVFYHMRMVPIPILLGKIVSKYDLFLLKQMSTQLSKLKVL